MRFVTLLNLRRNSCLSEGGLLIGVVLIVLMVLEVILVVLGVVLRQCSEQMFGTDSARNSVPSQLSRGDRSFRSVCTMVMAFHA